jgi:DNA-directed RNA polymerase specialized sigma24 family protein
VTVGNPLGWMHRIARNALIDHSRRPRQHVAVPEALPTETADAIAASRGALAECLRPLVMHLEPRSREALLATDLGGKSQVEAAREAGITVSTMKSRLQRGRQKLRGDGAPVAARSSACVGSRMGDHPMKVVLYARVSSDRQAEKDLSITALENVTYG